MFKQVMTRMFVLASCAAILSCSAKKCSSKKDIPVEQQLHSYISTAVDVRYPDQRDDLLSLTTGPMKSAIANATEEAFRTAYIDRHYEFRSFDVLEKRIVTPEKEAQLDFRIVYKTWLKGESQDKAPLIDTTNRATMMYENGQWALHSIRNLETSFDWEIGLPLEGIKAAAEGTEPVEVESTRNLMSQEEEDARKEATEAIEK